MKLLSVLFAIIFLIGVYPIEFSSSNPVPVDDQISCQSRTTTIQIMHDNKGEEVTEVPPDIPGPLYVKVSKKVDWVLNHLDTMDGWSFTGYSKLRMTRDFTPYRVKIGIINSDVTSLAHEDASNDPLWRQTLHGEQRRGVVFGISFGIKF